MRYAVEILRAAKESTTGLRYTDFRMVGTPQTRTDTLKALLDSDLLVLRSRRYRITSKGREILSLAARLMELEKK